MLTSDSEIFFAAVNCMNERLNIYWDNLYPKLGPNAQFWIDIGRYLGKNRIINRLIRMLQCMRVLFYDALSTGHSMGGVQKIQPVLILGNGIVEFHKNVKLGYFPSPFFFSGYTHLEARNKSASIMSLMVFSPAALMAILRAIMSSSITLRVTYPVRLLPVTTPSMLVLWHKVT